jgi:polysaccharide export outer membrane protein
MIPRMLLCAALVVLSSIASGPATAQEREKPVVQETQETAQAREEYQIGPEDVLNIIVWKNEAVSRTVPVRPDGMISLPMVNDVQAAGLTPMQLRDLLTKKLTEFIPAPEVSVLVIEVRSFKVSVIGEVAKPGRLELKSWTTVLDVLAMAGGLNQFASRSRIVILRPEAKTMKRIPFNYNKVISAGGEQENFFLQPGDIVVVP